MYISILVVDDEKNTREGLAVALGDKYEITVARDADEAFKLMDEESFDVVLTDLRMAGKSGLRVIDHAMSKAYKPACIMMTAYGSVETAVEAMKRGAFDFLTKPVNLEKLEILIERALKEKKLESENRLLHSRLDQKYSFQGVIGHSKALNIVLEKIKQVAASKATVLILGETGTGKELIAQLIHQNSNRSREPFVAVHCSAIPSTLLESELFGHEKGSFTGAHERRVGRFEAADRGTIFLDEIGEIDASTQVKLLRFLETRSFERVGSNQPIQVDVRVVCATHRNLSEMVEQGKFREDLYYRLNVVPITLPTLHERKEDIPLLLDYYLHSFSQENGIALPILQPDALKVLIEYPWPGNVRELKNFCEKLVVLHAGGNVSKYDLDERFLEEIEKGKVLPIESEIVKESVLPTFVRDEQEKKMIRNALKEAKGNKTKAAEILGMSRRTLHRKLLDWPELEYNS